MVTRPDGHDQHADDADGDAVGVVDRPPGRDPPSPAGARGPLPHAQAALVAVPHGDGAVLPGAAQLSTSPIATMWVGAAGACRPGSRLTPKVV